MCTMALLGVCGFQSEGRKEESEVQELEQPTLRGLQEEQGVCLHTRTRVGCQLPHAGMLQGFFLGTIQNDFE